MDTSLESNSQPARPPLTDSPWYWLYLFATAALAALFLMQPRFAARQAQIERNYQGRQRAAQIRSGERPSTPLSSEERTTIQLWPLFLIMSCLLAVAWAGLLLRHFSVRQKAPVQARSEGPIPEVADDLHPK